MPQADHCLNADQADETDKRGYCKGKIMVKTPVPWASIEVRSLGRGSAPRVFTKVPLRYPQYRPIRVIRAQAVAGLKYQHRYPAFLPRGPALRTTYCSCQCLSWARIGACCVTKYVAMTTVAANPASQSIASENASPSGRAAS